MMYWYANGSEVYVEGVSKVGRLYLSLRCVFWVDRSLKSESIERSQMGGQSAGIGDCTPVGLRLER